MNKVIGLVLIVVGIGLLYWGYDMSQSVSAQATEMVGGGMSDDVMFRYIGGAVALVVGLFFASKK